MPRDLTKIPRIRREDVPLVSGVGGVMLLMAGLKTAGYFMIGLAIGTLIKK